MCWITIRDSVRDVVMTSMQKLSLRNFFSKITRFILIIFCLFVGAFFYLDLHLYFRPIAQDLDKAIQQEMEAAKFPSAAVLIFKKDKVIFSKGYGFSNIEEKRRANKDTLYQIASISKLVTATAIMQLMEQGYFQLDDDINHYLPFRVRNPKYPEKPITFRMLLSHTGSIGDGPAYWNSYTIGESTDPTIPLGNFLTEYFTPNSKSYNPDKNFIASEPGTNLAYSNIGFGLLGYLVERISHKPFNEYCRTEIFKPLGMLSTSWFNKNVDRQKTAMPYGYDALRKIYKPIGYYGFPNYPDGLLKTSTSEFMRFISIFINGGLTIEGNQFLRPETIEEMLTPQFPNVSTIPAIAWAITGSYHAHGGSDPGVSTQVIISKEEKWGAIMFANSGGLQAWRTELGLEIRNGFYRYIKQYNIKHL